MWCRGIRGATTVDENSREAILEGTTELLNFMIESNDLEVDQIAAVTFTTTRDLNAEYPAVAARQLGLIDTALLCGHEMDVPRGLPKVIRILLLVNTDKGSKEMRHVYLRDAANLRPENSLASQSGQL